MSQDSGVLSDTTRQEIPIALPADKKRRTGPVRRRTRLGSAHAIRCGTAAIAAGEKKTASATALSCPRTRRPRVRRVLRKRHAPSGQPAAPSASAKCSRIMGTWHASTRASHSRARYHNPEVIVRRSRPEPRRSIHVPHDDASIGLNAPRRVSHRYRHMGQKEHCVSVRSSVTKACGDPHRGQPTYRRVAICGNHAMVSV